MCPGRALRAVRAHGLRFGLHCVLAHGSRCSALREAVPCTCCTCTTSRRSVQGKAPPALAARALSPCSRACPGAEQASSASFVHPAPLRAPPAPAGAATLLTAPRHSPPTPPGQVWAGVQPFFPGGGLISSTYKENSTWAFQDGVGTAVLRYCQVHDSCRGARGSGARTAGHRAWQHRAPFEPVRCSCRGSAAAGLQQSDVLSVMCRIVCTASHLYSRIELHGTPAPYRRPSPTAFCSSCPATPCLTS